MITRFWKNWKRGIVLTGSEIKSIRTGDVSMGDALCPAERGELWLYNTYIARYNAASYMGQRTHPHKKTVITPQNKIVSWPVR